MTEPLCPCGSGLPLDACCLPIIEGRALAERAVSLMRARYTAHVLGADDFIARSQTAEGEAEPARGRPRWVGLTIERVEAGEPTDDTGVVSFEARYIHRERLGVLAEVSRFVRTERGWIYVDGDLSPKPSRALGRNEPCPCGSGRKLKVCCGRP